MRLDTRRLLLALRSALLGLTLLTLLAATLAYLEVHAAAEQASGQAVPVLREVGTARTALLNADREAMRSFRTGAAALTGAGDGYRDQLAIAAQSLTRVAGLNLAGDEGLRQLQLVDSLLAAYSGSVEQAATQQRLPGNGPVLGAADLWQASRLLHSRDGVLGQLGEVAELQRKAFGAALDAAEPTVVRVLSWAVPGGLLFLLLIATQLVLARRFRRRLNPWLLGASLAVLALLTLTSVVFSSQQRMDAAEAGLDRLTEERQRHDEEVDAEGQRWLAELIQRQCPDCGPTVRAFLAGQRQPPDGLEQPELARKAGELAGQVREVGGRGAWWPAIPGLAVLVMLLVALGFRARLAEYGTWVRR
ncbi:hypothetical protein M8C13_20655 [Crossiella sp. SN42]|uniref:hypothetical protein n=1 Tax=Crossiella sp. SN42 TaxID=2944808 RepID=UPI00207D350D|nr:hypothetical protein [Crossiella sp. SN42]MCO1578166.1 hypothetical protein [Crossiella sp. SN42]